MILQNNDPYTQPSFSLRNRLARGVWGVVWLIFFRPTPPPLHGWRALLLRLFGAKLGKHVHISPSARVWAPWQLVVGDFVGVGGGANIYNMAPITIGDHAVISQGAHLCAGSHDYNKANFQLIAKPIDIGRHVWVCADAFVGLGVSISEGVVIGARSVVTKNPPLAWSVYAGNPCRKVGDRIQCDSGEVI
jgi:putative colanic acid biosynthesis acetyltransferase WcaF